jgi:hypothetical protein
MNNVGEDGGTRGGISAFLESIKPYQEIIGLGTALVVAVSGAVAWAVAHFATEAEVFYLECRINSNIAAQLLPIRQEFFAAEIDWRNSQIKQLAQQTGSSSTNSIIRQLSSEIGELNKQQTALLSELQKKLEDMSNRCNEEVPPKRT